MANNKIDARPGVKKAQAELKKHQENKAKPLVNPVPVDEFGRPISPENSWANLHDAVGRITEQDLAGL